MLIVYLTDLQKTIHFNDYPNKQPIKFIIQLKKIFPSTAELLLPVLPDDDNLDNVTWESTADDFSVFKMLLEAWGVIELRLNAISAYKNKEYTNQLIKKAQAKKISIAKKYPELTLVEQDYIFMHEIHSLLDAELVEIGEKFYLTTLRQLWKNQVSEKVLNGKLN